MQLEQIKNIIIDCQVRRLTNMETHARLRELGIDISIATVKNYKSQIKSQTQSWIQKLAKSRRGEYVSTYRERIQEVEAIQKQLWEIIRSAGTGPRSQIEACRALLNCTDLLTDLFDAVPVVDGMNNYIEGRYRVNGNGFPRSNTTNSYGVSGGDGNGNGNEDDSRHLEHWKYFHFIDRLALPSNDDKQRSLLSLSLLRVRHIFDRKHSICDNVTSFTTTTLLSLSPEDRPRGLLVSWFLPALARLAAVLSCQRRLVGV